MIVQILINRIHSIKIKSTILLLADAGTWEY